MHTENPVFNRNPYLKNLENCLSLPIPETVDTLSSRLNDLIGRSIAELAILAQAEIPQNNTLGKGFVGQLIELYLGADGANVSAPDFSKLNIELKTVSVGFDLLPITATSICSMKLEASNFGPFEESPLYHKLQSMLFVLIFAPKGLNLGDRFVVGYFYYQPSADDLAIFKADYESVANALYAGKIQELSPDDGEALQFRMKSSAKQIATSVRDDEGNLIYTQPRSFCLNVNFTKKLFSRFLQEQGITEGHLRCLETYRSLII